MSSAGTCAIHRAKLFPRLATLAKIYTADTWLVLDDVQFTRRDYQHRCRLAALNDPTRQQWLTLPVHLPNGQTTLINHVILAEPDRCPKLITRLIAQYYSKSPHWPTLRDILDTLIPTITTGAKLATVAETSTRLLLDVLDWTGVITHASAYPTSQERSQRLADLTHTTGAHTYLCGTGGARYLNTRPFTRHGIHIKQFNPHPINDHLPGSHNPQISALYHLAAHGPGAMRAAIEAGNADNESLRRGVDGGA
jgi:hypothetical protein